MFGPAERALDDPAHAEYRQTLVSLATAAGPVRICRDIDEAMGEAQEFTVVGLDWNRPATPRALCRRRRNCGELLSTGKRSAATRHGGQSTSFRRRGTVIPVTRHNKTRTRGVHNGFILVRLETWKLKRP